MTFALGRKGVGIALAIQATFEENDMMYGIKHKERK